MDERADLVLAADRHLKWRALDALERVLMQLCGVCLVGFTSTTLLDIVARVAGHPLLWPQEMTSAFFIRRLHRGVGSDAAQRSPAAPGLDRVDERSDAAGVRGHEPRRCHGRWTFLRRLRLAEFLDRLRQFPHA